MDRSGDAREHRQDAVGNEELVPRDELMRILAKGTQRRVVRVLPDHREILETEAADDGSDVLAALDDVNDRHESLGGYHDAGRAGNPEPSTLRRWHLAVARLGGVDEVGVDGNAIGEQALKGAWLGVGEGLDQAGHVVDGNALQKHVVRRYGDGRAYPAQLEAPGGRDARIDTGPPRRELEGAQKLFAAVHGARPFGVTFGAPLRTDE